MMMYYYHTSLRIYSSCASLFFDIMEIADAPRKAPRLRSRWSGVYMKRDRNQARWSPAKGILCEKKWWA